MMDNVNKNAGKLEWKLFTWNRLPDFSPAKMGLFRISIELQFGVCKHGKPYAIPCMTGKEKKGGRAIVNKESIVFHWQSSSQERKEVFLLSVELCCHYRIWDSPSSGLPVIFNWYFCSLNFLHFPLLIKTFLWKHHWSRFRFSIFSDFLSINVRKALFWVLCLTLEGDSAVTDWKLIKIIFK